MLATLPTQLKRINTVFYLRPAVMIDISKVCLSIARCSIVAMKVNKRYITGFIVDYLYQMRTWQGLGFPIDSTVQFVLVLFYGGKEAHSDPGQAYEAGWRVNARCSHGKMRGMKQMRNAMNRRNWIWKRWSGRVAKAFPCKTFGPV